MACAIKLFFTLAVFSFEGKLLAFPENIRLGWKMVGSKKRTSVQFGCINYVCKMFYNTAFIIRAILSVREEGDAIKRERERERERKRSQ